MKNETLISPHYILALVVRVLIIASCCPGFTVSLKSSSLSLSLPMRMSKPNNNDNPTASSSNPKPPIVYTIAGSDSGGGAGIQADLHAIHGMGCYGCSAITCLTAQNSIGVTDIHIPPVEFLKSQLDCLLTDLPPVAIKIGMLGTKDLIVTVGNMLKQIHDDEQNSNSKDNKNNKVWIVVDPVMISTTGSKLLEDDAIDAMIECVFPYADIITPNKFEAETLLDRKLRSTTDVEQGARELLNKYGCRSVLIKGGHTLSTTTEELSNDSKKQQQQEVVESNTLEYAQDYLISSDPPPSKEGNQERMCDSSAESTKTNGVWIRTPRWDNSNTHGTGCTLSSSIASALAIGEDSRRRRREDNGDGCGGATNSIDIVDACCLAKAYVSAGIRTGIQMGSGPGPVVQTTFPSSWQDFPSIVMDHSTTNSNNEDDVVDNEGFVKMKSFAESTKATTTDSSTAVLGRIIPIVDTVEQVKELCVTPGVTDIQLRIKDTTESTIITERIRKCQEHCNKSDSDNIHLWINDYWEEAIDAAGFGSCCFGVHVGQEDLLNCILKGGIQKLKSKRIAIGVSTHTYGELSVALGIEPSYISMGPIFATQSKNVRFNPQGLWTVRKWKQLIPPSIPFVTIGGINTIDDATNNKNSGADSIAVISAITKSNDVAKSVKDLNTAME